MAEAREHSLAQLHLLARALRRDRARCSLAELDVLLAALAPYWAKQGQSYLKKTEKRLRAEATA